MEDDSSSGSGTLHVSTEELWKKAAQMQSGTEKLWQAIYQIELKLNRTKGVLVRGGRRQLQKCVCRIDGRGEAGLQCDFRLSREAL